ncbi:MAG TPA: TMEM175 family protein, partial [Streptosporangiaceae bacterium]|nr:TMEM175 family protein [Streptosporangiaceae bacterium]
MNKSRLESFSDGVFAVAITLLALDLAVKGHDSPKSLAHQLSDLWPAVVAYLISFFTIGIIWVNHHRVLNDVQVVTRSLLFINLILLAVTVAIPFATSTLADYLTDSGIDGHVAAALYAGVFELMSLSFVPLYEWVLRHDDCVRHPMPAAAKNPARLRFYAGQLPYLIAVGVAFLSAPAAVVITAVVAVYYVIVREAPQPPAPSLPSVPSAAELGSAGVRPVSRVVTIASAWAPSASGSGGSWAKQRRNAYWKQEPSSRDAAASQ